MEIVDKRVDSIENAITSNKIIAFVVNCERLQVMNNLIMVVNDRNVVVYLNEWYVVVVEELQSDLFGEEDVIDE